MAKENKKQEKPKAKENKKQEKPKAKEPTKRELVVMYHKKGFENEIIAEKAETTLNSVRWYLSKEELKSNRPAKKDK